MGGTGSLPFERALANIEDNPYKGARQPHPSTLLSRHAQNLIVGTDPL